MSIYLSIKSLNNISKMTWSSNNYLFSCILYIFKVRTDSSVLTCSEDSNDIKPENQQDVDMHHNKVTVVF